jgi:hypothetical protein
VAAAAPAVALQVPMPAQPAVEAWQRAAAPLVLPHIAAAKAAAVAAAAQPRVLAPPPPLLASCRPALHASSA